MSSKGLCSNIISLAKVYVQIIYMSSRGLCSNNICLVEVYV